MTPLPLGTEALAELEATAATSLEAMLELLRARHPAAAAHARRVADLAVNIAMALQVPEPHLSDIERGALLHTIGHTAPHVPLLAGASAIAVAAHERYDGGGSPRGLAGDAIPLGARIVAVADAFDRIVSGMAGDPIPPAQALDVLATTRAAEFDPLVIGALKVLAPTHAPTAQGSETISGL